MYYFNVVEGVSVIDFLVFGTFREFLLVMDSKFTDFTQSPVPRYGTDAPQFDLNRRIQLLKNDRVLHDLMVKVALFVVTS